MGYLEVLIATVAIGGGGLLLALTLLLLRVKSLKAELMGLFQGDEDNPSALARSIDYLADRTAYHLTQQIKTSNAGIASGQAREQGRIETEVLEGIVGEVNPMLGMALQLASPKLKRMLARNPDLVMGVMQKLGKLPDNLSNGSSTVDIGRAN